MVQYEIDVPLSIPKYSLIHFLSQAKQVILKLKDNYSTSKGVGRKS